MLPKHFTTTWATNLFLITTFICNVDLVYSFITYQQVILIYCDFSRLVLLTLLGVLTLRVLSLVEVEYKAVPAPV